MNKTNAEIDAEVNAYLIRTLYERLQASEREATELKAKVVALDVQLHEEYKRFGEYYNEQQTKAMERWLAESDIEKKKIIRAHELEHARQRKLASLKKLHSNKK